MKKKDSAIINEIDKARLKLSIEHYIKYFIGKRTCEINRDEALNAIALAVREFAMDKMYETIARYNHVNSKRIYYLSVEYLIGRSLENNLHNLGLFNIMKSIKIDGFPDIKLEDIFDAEYDPALGNGGLGRLAACYLDSMASLGIPGFGYGINYHFGLFKQKFENGYQIEQADSWLGEDSPWQFARPDRTVKIPIKTALTFLLFIHICCDLSTLLFSSCISVFSALFVSSATALSVFPSLFFSLP